MIVRSDIELRNSTELLKYGSIANTIKMQINVDGKKPK